ncbi:hypothetical protein BDP55DRAFT_56620 [Colletotrichum godetiae]|uniref:Uncharacterized protein n=1 Tax=Colletotrichum godetiae TaxID=1209918 RepID=A0AAJ0ELY3_9PEZI|nr:uncharacterized protein BDP55DRAFT_56620 [Colletotrichum godetiae]KAK1656851.1 hypothetical protein BDP55DRAFT_56620 [Colletotrichum godetiae]
MKGSGHPPVLGDFENPSLLKENRNQTPVLDPDSAPGPSVIPAASIPLPLPGLSTPKTSQSYPLAPGSHVPSKTPKDPDRSPGSAMPLHRASNVTSTILDRSVSGVLAGGQDNDRDLHAKTTKNRCKKESSGTICQMLAGWLPLTPFTRHPDRHIGR